VHGGDSINFGTAVLETALKKGIIINETAGYNGMHQLLDSHTGTAKRNGVEQQNEAGPIIVYTHTYTIPLHTFYMQTQCH
jgi:hypothetical protein